MEFVEQDNPIKAGGSWAMQHLCSFNSKTSNIVSSLYAKFAKQFYFRWLY